MANARKLLLNSTIIAGSIALAAMSVPALAQTAAETKGETAKSAEIEELVVTGSRLKRSNFNSPAPITVITTENSALQGLVDTGAIL